MTTIRTMAFAGAACALIVAACDSDRSVKDDLETEVQRGRTAVVAAVDTFCTCAVDPTSHMCTEAPAMCSTDMASCQKRSLDDPYLNPYYPTDAQNAQCVLAAFKLKPAESMTFLSCVRGAWDLYAACMDKAGCNYDAVVSCESNDRQAAQKACGLLPQEVQTAINLCLDITDAGL